MATGPGANIQLQSILTALNNFIAPAHIATIVLIPGEHSSDQNIHYSTKGGHIKRNEN